MPTSRDARLDGAASNRPSNRVLGVIPARLLSTRLPNKPLVPLHGRPLIEWVWNRVKGMPVFDRVVVATDSPEVEQVCVSIGAPVEMTSAEHPSGTDRVAEVAQMPDYQDFPIVVNVQGDEPLVRVEHVQAAVEMVADQGWEIGTCATPLRDEAHLDDPSVVKVARSASGQALYFSRSAIPHKRDGRPTPSELADGRFLRHLGLYAYTQAALRRWVALDASPLEKLERLEQLRPLEAGLRIGVALVGEAERGVDTLADVKLTEERLRDLGLGPLATSGA